MRIRAVAIALVIVGLARTRDGVLHLAWSHPAGPNTPVPPSAGRG
jgi:hypothetical protein